VAAPAVAPQCNITRMLVSGDLRAARTDDRLGCKSSIVLCG